MGGWFINLDHQRHFMLMLVACRLHKTFVTVAFELPGV